MKPVIDVHAHLSNGMDLPLMGYLLSRRSNNVLERILLPMLAPILAGSLRKTMKRGLQGDLFTPKLWQFVLSFAYKALGKGVERWARTLGKSVREIAEELLDTYGDDGIDLFIPLILDYEYWFVNTPDNLIQDQIDHIYEEIIVPYGGRIHPFVAFDPARELAYLNSMTNPD
ncbi:MAG: hypothetical protein ACYTFG_15825, partial [Planctomycetota bacterium]